MILETQWEVPQCKCSYTTPCVVWVGGGECG